MEITYLGHSSFKIKGKSASVVIDPFDSSFLGLAYPSVTADIVLVSHQHGDHNKHELVKDVKKVFDGPGEYEMMGVSILGIGTFHDNKKGELRGKNTIFLIEIDGFRIVHLGDLGHKLNTRILEKLGEIDILMIPVGGYYTISPEEAVQVAQSIEAGITIPMHYQTKGIKQDIYDNLKPMDEFIAKMNLPRETLLKLVVKKDLMGEDKKIVVLEMK